LHKNPAGILFLIKRRKKRRIQTMQSKQPPMMFTDFLLGENTVRRQNRCRSGIGSKCDCFAYSFFYTTLFLFFIEFVLNVFRQHHAAHIARLVVPRRFNLLDGQPICGRKIKIGKIIAYATRV
jgi:hypothetical protein